MNDSNTDGSFTVTDPSSFMSPQEIRPTLRDILGIFSYFIMKCMLCVFIRIALYKRI